MLSGVNGAGKTTIAMRLLPDFLGIYDFVNADEIARGLSPLDPSRAQVAAGKLLLARVAELTRRRSSFAFETTGAGRGHLATLRACKAAGYQVELLYVWLNDPDMAVARVAQRVEQGGHNVPEATIRRRYFKSLQNLIEFYLPVADEAAVYDNSIRDRPPVKVIQKNRTGLQVYCHERWNRLQSLARTADCSA